MEVGMGLHLGFRLSPKRTGMGARGLHTALAVGLSHCCSSDYYKGGNHLCCLNRSKQTSCTECQQQLSPLYLRVWTYLQC